METRPAEVIRQVELTTGYKMRLANGETIEKYVIESHKVAVLINTFSTRETAREIRVEKKGKRLLSYTLAPTAWSDGEEVWTAQQLFLWDEDFVPIITVKYGRRETPAETRDRLKWESECHRPGTPRNPMDNYSRTTDEPRYAAPRMVKHWK